ncbi:MAG TPA: response regulator [Steroidobacteraceae bacterium]|jgi:CheY-like chemotaxis protein|nr:response regulator [Steroidobacteraceae bacterium]
MARKRALVVDDSKSARVILSRILEKYEVEVDMAASAEQAIEYLKNNRPDAIFMDHLMPGMDGLQAVREIKGNPQTAMIPIMMYTSQEGELYVGQARALGAMGVLPKQLRPVDVSKVLYELHLLPNRRDGTEPALSPVELDAGASPFDNSKPQKSAEAVPDDIRRFIADALNSAAARIVRDIRDAMPMQAGEPLVPLRPLPPAQPIWPVAVAMLAACVIACAFAASWLVARNDLASARAANAGLTSANEELQRSRGELSAAVKELTAALAAANGNAAAAAAGAAAAGSSPSAIAPRVEPVPYGEIPFDRSRIDALREVLATLESQGFHGVVKVTNLAGNYCLSGNSTDGYTPAAAALPVSRCDLIGNPFAESLSSQQRQSLAFANLIDGVRQRTSGAITVAIENQATGTGAGTPYPTRSDTLTAGEWNRAAAANNRVEFSAEGSP